jgi:uncharacterized Zn finger protein
MEIPINQFEQFIEEKILARGLSYFRNGHVNEPEEIAPGLFEAIVEGTENYLVQVKINKGLIEEHVCNCPYDLGPICKHVAAVLFYLQQEELEIEPRKPKVQGKKKERKKRKTKAEQTVELLEKISHDDLKQFIIDRSMQDRYFRDLFLSSFAHHNSGESKEQYSQQIASLLRTASDRHGFIDWSASRQVGVEVFHLINTARKQLENNNFKTAFYLSTAIMEQMTEAIQFSDDSNGDIGGSIDSACDILFDMTSLKLPEEIRKLIFDYCIDAYKNDVYGGWHWHLSMLYLASSIITTNEEFDIIINLIDNTESLSEYSVEMTQNIKYEILLKIKGEQEANEYLEKNLSNSMLRRTAIINAIGNKDYEKARKLSLDGIKQDEKDLPGQAKEWYDWLLKVAQATKDKEKIIEYARFLFIDNFRNEQDYYQILKQHIQPEKWDNYVKNIIQDISAKKRWLDTNLISRIYIREEWWPELLELLKKSPELNTISNYEQYLAKDYSDELVQLYSSAIIRYLERNIGRKYYKDACKYLRKIIKLGDRDKANELIEKFRNDYPARRALMEELNKV